MHRTCLILLASLVVAGDALAQTQYRLEPNPARRGQAISLRIDDAQGCYPATGFDLRQEQGRLTVEARITDAGPCLPQYATPRLVAIGGLAAGTYRVEVFRCGNVPPPAPQCSLDALLTLVVQQAAIPRAVPALSASGVAILLLGLLAALLPAFRRPH